MCANTFTGSDGDVRESLDPDFRPSGFRAH
jgi:hypothetical protein